MMDGLCRYWYSSSREIIPVLESGNYYSRETGGGSIVFTSEKMNTSSSQYSTRNK